MAMPKNKRETAVSAPLAGEDGMIAISGPQPMDTAPKDGSTVVLTDQSGASQQARWRRSRKYDRFEGVWNETGGWVSAMSGMPIALRNIVSWGLPEDGNADLRRELAAVAEKRREELAAE